MIDNSGKSWKMLTGEDKKSHLPFAGIILVRFYGYYLSQIDPATCGDASAPRELKKPVFRRSYKDR